MHKINYCLFTVTLAVLFAGCNLLTDSSGTGGSTSDADEPTSLLAADDGGYDTSDDSPFFGLSSMEQFVDDEEVEDPTVTEEEEAIEETDPTAEVYYLRLVWGNLELDGFSDEDRDDIPSSWYDWSGTLTLSGDGALVLKRTILFDRHDRIVSEDDRKLVQWRSYTGPHIDGVLVKLIYVPDPEIENPKVTLTTDLATVEIPIDEIDRYNEIFTVTEDGQGVAITGILKRPGDCQAGFMQGKYHDRPSGEGGIFRGRFLSQAGGLHGHLRGHYGVNDAGQKLFFGKYVTNTGRFRGLLQGSYGDGAFSGVWLDSGHAAEGTLDGKYVVGETVDSGFFQGFWEKDCE